MTSFIISCLPQKVFLVVQFTEPFFPPPFPPPLTPSGDAVPYSQVQGLHSITHHFQSLAALIILSSPHHVTSNVALAFAKQPANAPFPISCHAKLSHEGRHSQTTASLLPHRPHVSLTSSLLSLCLILSPVSGRCSE